MTEGIYKLDGVSPDDNKPCSELVDTGVNKENLLNLYASALYNHDATYPIAHVKKGWPPP